MTYPLMSSNYFSSYFRKVTNISFSDYVTRMRINHARELLEETGLKVTEEDEVSIINPCLFSTPGMTDESNALVKIVLNRDSLNGMSQDGAVGGELFDGFDLLTKAQAKKILEDGVDEHGIYYSVYTWAALTYFVADLWR